MRDWKCSELIPFLYFALSLLFLSSSPLLKEKDNKLLLSVSLYSHKKEGERKREAHKKNQRLILVHSLTHTQTLSHFFFFLDIYTGHTVAQCNRQSLDSGRKEETEQSGCGEE